MTPDERALLDAVIAAPDDDLPRLVYADWLDEHGRAERAEFIRLQCWLSQPTSELSPGPFTASWARRLEVLNRDCVPEWRIHLPVVAGVRWKEFRRGFIEGVIVRHCSDPLHLVAVLNSAVSHQPIRDLEVVLPYSWVEAYRRLFSWHGLQCIRWLRVAASSTWSWEG